MPGIPFKTPAEYGNGELAKPQMLAASTPTRHEPSREHPHPQPDKPSEPEPEKQPPHQPPHQPHEPSEIGAVSMTASNLKEIISTCITEARKPILDERAIAARERMKVRNKQLRIDNQRVLMARFQNCNHMHMPGSVMTGCCCIAWATQSDNIKRGPCQHCGTMFSPIREECANEAIWEAYKYLVRLPTHPAGNINHIFTAA